MRSFFRRALCLAFLSYAPAVASQPAHFSDCSTSTGRSASLVIPLDASFVVTQHLAPSAPVPEGAELGVFTPDGVCAGALRWNGDATALALWADDPITPDRDGFVQGDTLIYRLWDTSTRDELTAMSVRYALPSSRAGRYVVDGVYLLSELAFSHAQGEVDPTSTFAFEPNYPNPFTSRTTFRYQLPEPARVRLELYDLLGRRVATLVDERLSPGWHETSLEARGLGGGTYIARLTAGSHTATQRITLVR